MSEMKRLITPKRKGPYVWTPIFRTAFCNVVEPKEDMNGDKKYEVTMLFDEGVDLTFFKEAMSQAVQEKWGSNPPVKIHDPIKRGNDQLSSKTGKTYAGYAGCTAIRAWSNSKPGAVDENVIPITDSDAFYSGCYAQAKVKVAAFDRKTKKGVTVYLDNIVKVADGEPLGGTKPSAASDFSEIKKSTVEDAFSMDDNEDPSSSNSGNAPW